MLAGYLLRDRIIIYDIDGFMAIARMRPINLDLMQALHRGSFTDRKTLLFEAFNMCNLLLCCPLS
jgi:hypothetical protein